MVERNTVNILIGVRFTLRATYEVLLLYMIVSLYLRLYSFPQPLLLFVLTYIFSTRVYSYIYTYYSKQYYLSYIGFHICV